MSEPVVEMTAATATCSNADCEYVGVEVGLLVPSDPWPPPVQCGPCGAPITDLRRGIGDA